MTTPSSEDKTVAEAMPFDAFQIRSFTARASSVGDAHELSGDSIYEFARMLWGAFVAHNRTALAASGSKGGDERAAFEAWFKDRFGFLPERCESRGYCCPQDAHLWEAWQARAAAPAEQSAARPEGRTQAARDVLAERQRQVSVEGWTPKHDDEHGEGEMAQAAAVYANPEIWNVFGASRIGWPWDASWYKPRDPRSNYVRAAALLLAEIERLDRAAPAAVQTKGKDDSPSAQPCGHHTSLLLHSAETGQPLYCELCDALSAKRDAETREQELQGNLRECEATCDNLARALREEVEAPTFMGEPVLSSKAAPQTAAPAAQPEPVFPSEQADRLLRECLKPEEINGPERSTRIRELLYWFVRYADRDANPKWLYGHAFELAYALATAAPPPAAQSDEALIAAAKAVVERWDTPAWKDVGPTADYINRLRAALAQKGTDHG